MIRRRLARWLLPRGGISPPEPYRLPPYWTVVSRLFSAEDCRLLVEEAGAVGWTAGTFADRTPRPNVQVCFLDEGTRQAAAWIERFRLQAEIFGPLFGVDVEPAELSQVQVSHWSPGDSYGYHSDHDPAGTVARDRKLSLYVNLGGVGGLEIDRAGMIHCRVGDCLAFNALVSHAAPKLEDEDRYSVVAWISGPPWR